MTRFKNILPAFIAVILTIAGAAGFGDAQQRNDRQVRDLVRSLNSRIDDFQYTLDYQLRSSSANRQDTDDVKSSIGNLQSKVRAFEDNFNQKRENRDDINDIVMAAKDVDAFLAQNPQNQGLQRDWSGVRDLIGRLAANYGVTPDWNSRGSSNYPSTLPDRSNNRTSSRIGTADSNGLTGTYRLDTSRSENTDQIISQTRIADAQKQDLQQKLEAPEQLAIDVNGSSITLASSKASAVSFVADGREKTETDSNGRTVRLRATLRGQELTVSSLGGDTDYTVTFTPQDNGRTLKVTRRITTEYLDQTVFAESVYEKTDSVAGLGIEPTDRDTGGYSSNDPNGQNSSYGGSPVITPGRSGEYVVPNGTIITGLLESTIDTKVSQNNDRFRMTVQSPIEYRGAVIEGYISGVGRSGQVSGRSNVTFNFERITLRDGKTYDFAGFLQSIKDQNGKTVKVDTEGTAKGNSQTKETAKRGGLGAGLGAVIGAIAGGGTGAAVGAIIGGGVGAGSVIVQGRDDVQLMKGSMITVQASSPIRDRQPQDN